MGESGRLTPAQQRFLIALIEARTLREAAQTAGVAEGSARRWMRSERFRAALGERMDALIDSAAVGLARDMAQARATLLDLLEDAPPAVRVSAAAKILDVAIRLVEMRGIARRLDAIERTLERGDE